MIDLKYLRDHPEVVRLSMRKRKHSGDEVDAVLSLDEEWRRLFTRQNNLRSEQKKRSEEIATRKRNKEDVTAEIVEMKELAQQVRELEVTLKEKEEALQGLLAKLPNLLHSSVPEGSDDSANLCLRSWGEIPSFSFTPLPHWELASRLKLFDLERGSKVAGSGFILYTGWGAKLERALINWMLDFHGRKHGYQEVFPPFVVNRETAFGTGKLPDFEGQMYTFTNADLFLNPTAEVPVTALFAGETLKAEELPLSYVAYTACFRREAGAAGKDTRGLLRVHQFDKVELVKFTRPEQSFAELETLVRDAEEIIQALELPYQVVELCGGDIGFGAAKAYDINVWAPGAGKWLEVSSCSNCTDFQARRLNTRFRNPESGKLEFVHTLNGSGVALPRTVAALLENHQQADGSVRLPPVLVPYMGVERITSA
ncbi:MAG: serine--tRNA ligase [Coprothermobacterota bacterium]|nr:serine--tRNA ligase [Coprothermobacterota bacterium]